ncbi:Dabb family protein [Staphylococcus capitis]|uniref:Dabb family protein n=1 Tax=Staphylococcus capitis TaxID=29388 RepID=UPI003CFD9A20
MIEHIVVVKARAGAEMAVTEALVEFAAGIAVLPGLIELTVGPNVHTRSLDAGVTHGMLVRLVDEAALDRYQKHPVHAALLPKLDQTCVGRIVLDWVVERDPAGAAA